MEIKKFRSFNFDKKKRSDKSIKIIVIHYTGMQSERESIHRLCDPKSKVSSHFVIGRDGKIYRLVEDNEIAWHAGKSCWRGYRNINKNSIGIELVNKGHEYGYTNFKKEQLSSLVRIIKKIIKKYKIKKINVIGHSDIAPLRKRDPGEKFPWHLLSKKKIGYSSNIAGKKNIKNYFLKKTNFRNTFFNNLYKIGYRYFDPRKSTSLDFKIIKAFQRRFRQTKVNGRIDQECLQISYNLARYYKN